MAAFYSIQELCDQTGLPRRTIHFYTQQGLLPAPEGAGLGARYTENHLFRLRAIPLLRQQGLRLDAIREKLNQMDPRQLQQLLTTSPAPSPSSNPLSPQSYDLYPLSGGIYIAAPRRLSPVDQRKLNLLLREAQKIFYPSALDFDQENK